MAAALIAALRVGAAFKRPLGGHEDETFRAQCSLLLFVEFEKQKQEQFFFYLSDGNKNNQNCRRVGN